jgi:hypothetical protein
MVTINIANAKYPISNDKSSSKSQFLYPLEENILIFYHLKLGFDWKFEIGNLSLETI